ncbi:fibrinogen-like protein A [Mytilus edulis]|uniref:fibrinogen-like protein A n=1 Tax=Mytilus edulis TaxID=6550 RepID=UPI0039EE7AA3
MSTPETETTDNSNIMVKIPGNDNLHVLTTSRNYVVRFEMHDFKNNTAYAEYQAFKVDNEASQYRPRLHLLDTRAIVIKSNGFESNNGMKFTTRDRDNDLHQYHCGQGQIGAWWYNACGESSLNGIYKPEGTATDQRNLKPRDCSDLPPCTRSGVFEIHPDDTNKIDVYCDMDNNGGGWTIVQRRVDSSVDFYRFWNDYKNGFGSVSENHWLGNDNLHILTTSRNYVVRFEVHDFNNKTAYAEYQNFKVDNEASQYRITYAGYTGTAGNGFESNNGMKFTTRDRDNDLHPYHCGKGQIGAWWYNACGKSSLNGIYKQEGTTVAKRIYWKTWRPTTLKATEIKIRSIN